MEIPLREDWGNFEADLDARYAFRNFFGRSIAEAIPRIQENPIESASEIRFMPPPAFRYYIFAFRDYLLSEESREDSDAASCYLSLIAGKITEEPETIIPVIEDLVESVQKVAEHQSFYDADIDIYGDFKQISARILAAYQNQKAQGTR